MATTALTTEHSMSALSCKCIVIALTLTTLSTPVIAQIRCASVQGHVQINERSVPHGTARTLLELLRRSPIVFRVPLNASVPDEQPYVVIDGVGLHGGLHRLEDVALDNVVGVTILRPTDGVSRFGQRAYRGAIIVMTQGGPSCTSPRH
jgi:hypothetical protein